ncbi:MAG: DUF2953 domain-containing protein [Bacillota bacterium]
MIIYVIIFIIAIVLYFIPLELVIDYQRKEEQDNLIIKVRIFLLHYQLKLSLLDLKHLFSFPRAELKGKFSGLFSEKNIEFKEELSAEELKQLKSYTTILRRIAARFELILLLTHNCSFFSWKSSFGFRNPACTGLVTGLLWSWKGAIVAVLQNKLQFKKLPVIEVNPNFNNLEPLKIEFKSIFAFRLGKLIITAVKISLYEFKRRIKQKWKNIQLLN